MQPPGQGKGRKIPDFVPKLAKTDLVKARMSCPGPQRNHTPQREALNKTQEGAQGSLPLPLIYLKAKQSFLGIKQMIRE